MSQVTHTVKVDYGQYSTTVEVTVDENEETEVVKSIARRRAMKAVGGEFLPMAYTNESIVASRFDFE